MNTYPWCYEASDQLQRRFERTRNTQDLTDAIGIREKALRFTPRNHQGWAGCLNDLGVKLIRLYEVTRRLEGLEQAISTAQMAVTATAKTDQSLARRLHNLSNMLE